MFFDPMYFLFIAPAVILGHLGPGAHPFDLCPGPADACAVERGRRRAAHPRFGRPDQRGNRGDSRPVDRPLRLAGKGAAAEPDVYRSRTLAAVGIAAHESGHALQDALAYAPLAIRNAAVPAANIGTTVSFPLIFIGAAAAREPVLIWAGIILFSAFVAFQIVNLPVEFNASSRAKAQLVGLGIIDQEELRYVSKVLGAAALDVCRRHAPGDSDIAVLRHAVQQPGLTGIIGERRSTGFQPVFGRHRQVPVLHPSLANNPD